jgi:hypothetical protein
MGRLTLIVTLIATLALSAGMTATAMAEVTSWAWSPGKVGETFKGESGKTTLQVKGGLTVACKKAEVKAKGGDLLEEGSVEGKDATSALAIITFSGCTTTGLSSNSKGDASGVILFHTEVHNCLISEKAFGLLIELLTAEIEVPASKLTLTVTGGFIAEVTPGGSLPAKKWNLVVVQKEGMQAIGNCEGGSAETLLTSIDGGSATQSAEEIKEGSFEFENAAQEQLRRPPVWEATRRYLVGAKVEWRANSGNCYESNQITEGEQPPSTPWDSITCP